MDTATRVKIKDILEKLGLNKNQVKFYVALLELGKGTLNEIIKRSGLKKPTAYRMQLELEQMGIINRDVKRKYKQQFSVVSPKLLLALAGNKQRKMRRLELEIKESLPELSAFFQNNSIKPGVELFEDKQGYHYLADKSLDSIDKEIFYLGNLEDFYKVFDEEYDQKYYIPTRVERNIHLKWLLPKSKKTIKIQKQDSQVLRETRFFPEGYVICASMMVYDNTVVFFSSYKEMIALNVVSEYLAQMQKSVFQMIWDMVE